MYTYKLALTISAAATLAASAYNISTMKYDRAANGEPWRNRGSKRSKRQRGKA